MNEKSSAVRAHKQSLWWLPLARRVVGWSLAGALAWALPMIIAFGSAAFYFYLHPPPLDPEMGTGIFWSDNYLPDILLWAGLLIGIILGTLGLVTGAVAGFYAPVVDCKNPLKSRFFRSVNGQTFWFWLATSLAIAATIAALNSFVLQIASLGVSLLWGVAFSALLFPLAVWRAVNRAIDAATALDL